MLSAPPVLHRGATRMLGATYVQRHPRTGGYWFRRRVPDHLRPIIGRREITKTLGTKCLSEAKRLSRPYADATDDLFDEAQERLEPQIFCKIPIVAGFLKCSVRSSTALDADGINFS